MRSFHHRSYTARDPTASSVIFIDATSAPAMMQRRSPQPAFQVHTPSPSSSSGASGSSGSSSRRSSVSRTSAHSSAPSSRAASATTTSVMGQVDDTDMWSSIRLASSPPQATHAPRPSAAQYGRGSTHHVAAPRNTYAASPPLVIDDFSQDRVSHAPAAVQPSAMASSHAKPPLKTSWSLRQQQTTPTPVMSPPPPTPVLPRAHSLQEPADINVMDHRVFVGRDQWVQHKERRACVVCDREFGMLLRKKHSCRMCGEVVCSRCSLFKSVKLPGVGESKARVCSRCFLQYRQRVLHKTLSSDDVVVPSVAEATHETPDSCTHTEPNESPSDDDRDHEFGYDSHDELPSVEDVMRRTAAKVGMSAAAVAPFSFGRPENRLRQCKPVSLLAPEMLDAMYRESTTLAAASMLQSHGSNHSRSFYNNRAPSMMLLSPTTSYDLMDMRLFDLDQTQSFSSNSTVSSSLSSGSLSSTMSSLSSSTVSSARQATEEELAAAIRARELEKEVEESRERIQELERRMQEQENHKAELSLEQQKQLREARELIAQLQEQLKQQESDARDAAYTRDSICLTNLRQQQQYTAQVETANAPRSRTNRSDSVEAESEALRQKLRLLERQLQQAGINVAEVIPYAIAKQRITEISRRMAEISEAEATMKLQNPKGVAMLRREYYVLEQDMERFHTALLMSDEYMEEQASREREWEQLHEQTNGIALRRVRSALPVEISKLSEQTLRTMVTPSGKHMSADLARRFKRTNVLQLLRVAPQTIVRMHPSVIESYRTTGLALLERRALHAALKPAGSEWQKQSRDELAQKKAAWFRKLKDAFIQALLAYDQHIAQHHNIDSGECPFIGKMCVLRAEQAVAQLYGAQLGFPEDAQFIQQEIIKSDPEGAGEKALQEARAQVQATRAAAKANARQAELKRHYGMKNVRFVTMALAAMEEMDAAISQLRMLDDEAADKLHAEDQTPLWSVCERIVTEARDLAAHMARRAGICLTGKRDPAKDAPDSRSPLEASLCRDSLVYLSSVIDDVVATVSSPTSQLKNAINRIRELVSDVTAKDDALFLVAEEGAGERTDKGDQSLVSRVAWKGREPSKAMATEAKVEPVDSSACSSAKAVESAPMPRRAPLLPRGSALLDAIRAKRTVAPEDTNAVREPTIPVPAPEPTPAVEVTVADLIQAAPVEAPASAATEIATAVTVSEASEVAEVVEVGEVVDDADVEDDAEIGEVAEIAEIAVVFAEDSVAEMIPVISMAEEMPDVEEAEMVSKIYAAPAPSVVQPEVVVASPATVVVALTAVEDEEIQKPTNLLAAIRARKAKALAQAQAQAQAQTEATQAA